MSATDNPLVTLSENMADAVERATGSLVTVSARRRMPATGIVWTDDGLIVTANHVVERDEEIRVGLADGNEAAAELVGRDPSTDIAVLKVEGASLTPATKASGAARPGHLVLAVGKPFSHSAMVALGAVSLIHETMRTHAGGAIEGGIHSDVTMYPGFSGGPLINAAGEVLGMNSSGIGREMAVTIPHAVVDRVVATLREKGRISRGYLGVALQPVRIPEAIQSELEGDQEVGLMVIGVEEDSPAAAAGMLLGDTLVRLGDEATDDVRGRHASLGPDSVGAEYPATVVRAGELVNLQVTVGERQADPQRERRGGRRGGPRGGGPRGPRGRRGGGREARA